MERDVRDATDRRGFCGAHLKMMAVSKNVHGLALMMQTRLMRVEKAMAGGIKAKLGDISLAGTCYICDSVNSTFEKYVNTFFYLWERENDFKTLAESCKGFCVPHYMALMNAGEKALAAKDYAAFKDKFYKIQTENLKRLEEEIEWFVKKFDYRNADAPWGNSKDSVERVIKKLSSKAI